MNDHVIQQRQEEDTADLDPAQTYRTVEKCEIEIPQPAALIIFGASGDLTRRKLLPSLYRLFKNKILSEQFFILGTSRAKMTTAQFRVSMFEAVRETLPKDFDQSVWDEFTSHIYYSTFDYSDPTSYTGSLRDLLPGLESRFQTGGNRVFYLAIPPIVFEEVIHNLGAAGLSREGSHLCTEAKPARAYSLSGKPDIPHRPLLG